ncbi:hypothetical protein GW626_11910 [Peribacillus muralis]|uniref:hypothetical protein n=1 Tax=Peribacillus muralis TaxID=264697 RepID=UPI001F4EBD9B|nr:hypothetical protein [Peribacillus muralis]MCK1991040.1 hypothetical protein [Peribacillus muralis]MCK2011594.1 hypothetical protein [Peribacillus muralis]
MDDAILFLARFKNGALGSFEVTRSAAGYRCVTKLHDERFVMDQSIGGETHEITGDIS